MQEAVDIGLKKLRFPREVRRFQAHLTLGRVKESGPASKELGRMIEEEYGEYDADLAAVDEVVTFASFLDRSGSKYEPLGHADLRGESNK